MFPGILVNDGAKVAKYWLATGDVVLAKNIRLHGEYAFDVKTDTDTDYDDLASVSPTTPSNQGYKKNEKEALRGFFFIGIDTYLCIHK